MTEEGDNLDTQAPDATDQPAPSWRDSLPDDLKVDPSITKFNDVESLAKSYVNAQRLIGQDKIPMPQTDEDFLQVFRKLGAPEEADGYEFSDIEWPEGFKRPEGDNGLREAALNAGLTKKQADAINKWHNESLIGLAKTRKEQMDAMAEKTKAAIKKEWGDAAEGNIELAKRVISDYGDEDTKDFLKSTGLGNDINLLRVFGKIGQKLVEDRVIEGPKSTGMSPLDLKTKIASLQGHQAYTDKKHPAHNDYVRQVQELYQKLNPE